MESKPIPNIAQRLAEACSAGSCLVLCIIALVVFSVMSVGSAKYKKLARDALRCVFKNLTLSPCDVGLEQKIKGKITAKLLGRPRLARFFYRNFTAISWAFTATFFASLVYSAYSFYNLFVYGSCEPGGSCVLIPIIPALSWCILLIERAIAYIVLAILVGVLVYIIYRHFRRQ